MNARITINISDRGDGSNVHDIEDHIEVEGNGLPGFTFSYEMPIEHVMVMMHEYMKAYEANKAMVNTP